MSKGMKIFVWVLVIIAILAVIAFVWGKNAWDKVSFSAPKLQGFNLQGLSAADLAAIALTGSTKQINATIAMEVKNGNSFSIPFSNMNVQMFYNGTLIAESSPLLAAKNKVPANGSLTLFDTVTITLNRAGGKLLYEKVTNKNPVIDYTIGIRIFGIPIPGLRGNFTA